MSEEIMINLRKKIQESVNLFTKCLTQNLQMFMNLQWASLSFIDIELKFKRSFEIEISLIKCLNIHKSVKVVHNSGK